MPSPRHRLFTTLVLVTISAILFAPAARAEPPLIAWPRDGFEAALGYSGPVEVFWAESGEMRLEVAGPGYSYILLPITVAAEEVNHVQQYSIDPLPSYGRYTITAGRADGTEDASVSFTAPPPNDATMVSPADGGAVAFGWQGPIRIRWSSIKHPAAYYIVGVDGTGWCLYTGSELSPGTVTSCMLSWVPALGSHTVTVEEAGVETFLLAGFSVEPRLRLVSLSVAPYRFYPYVRDGYRDRTVLRFALNKEASVVVKVRNGNDRIVRRVALGALEDGSWAWNGRTGGGRLVPTGRYRVELKAKALGEVRRWVRAVVVGSG